MFGDILRKLTQTNPAPLPQQDARLALTALLVRVARTDNFYSPQEVAKIEKIVANRYGLDAAAAAALRTEGEALETQAPDTVRFTWAIKESVAYEDREAVVEAMWQVALADGNRDDNEDALLRLSCHLLGVNDRDSARARQRVENAT
jgi:uncharacterized tellurite resistance protein B-like protein